MTDRPEPERLLVDYWYAHPVGHAVEGLRYALGYKEANPGLRVSLLLSAVAPVELARLCPWLDAVYPVPFTSFAHVEGDPAAALADVPREWDWLVENHRTHERSHDAFAGFRAFYDAAHAHFAPRHPTGIAGAEPPAYLPHRQLRLEPPQEERDAARATVAGRPAIAVVLAGSSPQRELYPPLTSWELVLSELAAEHPEHVLLLVGKLAADGRTTTAVTRAEVDRLLLAVPAAVDCFDHPLLEQLALLEAADLLVSPHTGFAFLASTVGTPWLAISGGNWHEYFFNGVPVYSVLPDPRRFTAFGSDGMSEARVRADLPELLAAARQLLARELEYEQLLADYFPRLLEAYGGDRSRIFSFDALHERYL